MSTVNYHGSGRITVDEGAVPSSDEQGTEVAIRYAGVNPLDARLCRGAMDRVLRFPFVPGTEAAGQVEGRPVVVYGRGVGTSRPGTYRSRAVVPPGAVHPLPAGFDMVQAAALATAGVTAWSLVNTAGSVGAGDEVLVLGAGGGVGTIAVQLAVAVGARVLAQTASRDKAERLEALGAEALLVESPDDLAEALGETRPAVVFDGLGGGYTGAALGRLRTGGTIFVFGASAGAKGPMNLLALYRGQARIVGYASMAEAPEHVAGAITDLVSLIETGRLAIPIHDITPVRRVESAFDALEERRVFGKIVLDLG